MIAATITLSTAGAAALGLALIALGMLVQLRLTLWSEDCDDAAELVTVEDRDELLDAVFPPHAPDPTSGEWIEPRGGYANKIPEQRTSPEGGAR